jgi:asparagine synthase (glutamine-hydrolysing)
MCGIAGGYWTAGSDAASEQMRLGLQALRHRGPDHQGYEELGMPVGSVLLGHARLSVIDLSAAAHQPMHSGDGRLSIVFNGEIYNYLELRAELEQCGMRFSTRSDTEVLLAAWAAWGAAALRRFIGMFAFVLVDRERQLLLAARDGFGIKPLYYVQDRDGFRFASELPALRALRTDGNPLNWQRAYDYLVHGEYDFGDDTFVEGVRSLTPGHLLTLDLRPGAVPQLQEWWSPRAAHSVHLPFEEAALELRRLILDNVRMHLRSDVPLGAALSGGLDSSAIVCAMRHLEPDADINTFSFIATGASVSEEHWVDRVNQHVGARPHKVVVSQAELAADLDDMIAAQGEPFGSTSIYAQYRVFRLARERGMTVTLDGQGADELLGGYNAYPGQRVRSLVEQGRPAAAGHFLRAWSRWPGRSLGQGLKRVAGAYSEGRLHQFLRQLDGMDNVPDWIRPGPLREAGVSLALPSQQNIYDKPGRRMMGSLAASLRQRGLPALLRHGDRNSMRFSVESRVPFLTCQFADFTLGLPEEYLVSLRGESKHLLRAAMRGIVPDDVLDRKDKIGFATPEQQWLLGMADTVRGWLAQDVGLPFLDQQRVVAEFDQVVSGRRAYTSQVWRWINFIRWYRNLA